MIRIEFRRQNSNDPGRQKRHPSRASCEVDGRRYETVGPAPIYKLATLLWLRSHGGADFEVWDDVSPFGKPGGLAMRGPVRNWALISNGRPMFTKDAKPDRSFTPQERESIARAAGRVTELAERDSSRPYKARTAPSCAPDGPEHPSDAERPSAAVVAAHASEAA